MFGEVAEAYDRARPSYPASVVDEVLAFASIPSGPSGPSGSPGSPAARVLEVGAGTGKATVLFAERGLDVLCLEPDPALAAVLARNCAPFPGVRVDRRKFEEWPPEPSAFRLLVAAQSWHWVSPEGRYPKAHAALAPSGTLALMWNRHRWEDSDLGRALAQVYERLVPEVVAEEGPPVPHGWSGSDELAEEIGASGLFGGTTVSDHPWSLEYATEPYLELIETYSSHRMLEDARRGRLAEAIRAAIDDAGGRITIEYRTFVYLARRRNSPAEPGP